MTLASIPLLLGIRVQGCLNGCTGKAQRFRNTRPQCRSARCDVREAYRDSRAIHVGLLFKRYMFDLLPVDCCGAGLMCMPVRLSTRIFISLESCAVALTSTDAVGISRV